MHYFPGFIIWDVSPNVFSFMEIPRWYGLCWAVGIALGFTVMRHIYQTEKRPVEAVEELGLYLILGTILGARIGHIVFYDPVHYWQNPIEILPISMHPTFHFTGLSGLASHGGGIGLILSSFFYARKYKVSFLWLLDRIAIIVPLCGALIRFGNLMNSEMAGIPTDVPWAFIFARIDPVPRHPAQLYESIYCALLFIFTYFIWRRKRDFLPEGMIFSVFITVLFSFRFIDEFFKINQESFENDLLLNMGQILSTPYIIGGLIGINLLSKKRILQTKHN
jgi:phosphatidylglycerol:prolipoprotein diacylglycerol transferase